MPRCRNRRQCAPFLLIVLLHALPAQAFGQSPATDPWRQLGDAEAGSAFKVALSDGATLTAHLVSIDGDVVVLDQIQTTSAAVTFRMRAFRRGQLTLNRSDIASVQLLSTPVLEMQVPSFDRLRDVAAPGERITVAEANGATISGVLTAITASKITIRSGEQHRDFLETDVFVIRKKRRDSLLNGALIGLGVGAGMAAILCTPYDLQVGYCTTILVGPMMGVGTGIGLALDALITSETVLFQRRKTSSRMTIAPHIGATRKGLVLSIGF